jgi:hypothetical protein
LKTLQGTFLRDAPSEFKQNVVHLSTVYDIIPHPKNADAQHQAGILDLDGK